LFLKIFVLILFQQRIDKTNQFQTTVLRYKNLLNILTMDAKQPKYFTHSAQDQNGYGQNNQQTGRLPRREVNPTAEFELLILLQQIWLGIGKLFVVVKYLCFSIYQTLFNRRRLPWIKLGILGLATFFVLKKDMHFNINVGLPAFLTAHKSENAVEQFSMATPVSLHSTGTSQGIITATPAQIEAYITRFKRIAVLEMQKYGVPASIKMAQALLESNAGNNAAALGENNHFGRPFKGVIHDSAWESWRAHSLFLSQQHSELLQYGDNYTKWAQGLEKMGYASGDTQYAEKLIKIIEQYRLARLDVL
jgi:flagellum-specific peptidoglycan hydrolase FlgJ